MTFTHENATASVLARLSNHLDPARVVTGGPELDAAARVWNGAVDHRPALVVRCQTSVEVQHAVRAAREAGLALSVRGGGHDWAGRAIRPGGLVVDLTGMREVSVRDGVATVAGGATVAEVAEAADRVGLGAVTGTVGDVGMLGLSLGGGYGPFCGRFGLAADNLLAAQVVLADGTAVQAGEDDRDADPDLLWALRGGGGNFGVVTSATVALHPLVEVLAGSFTFPGEQAQQVLHGYAALLARAPDELTGVLTIASTPEGTAVVMVSPTWSGAPTHGRGVLEEFAALGTPLAAQISPMSPLTRLRQLDGAFPAGAHYVIRTRSIPSLTADTVSALVDAYAARTSPGSFLNIHHFHGAASRKPPQSTAFGLRQDHLMVEIIETGPSVSHTWTSTASTILAAHALPGGYPNLLGPDDQQQTAAAYGPNTNRLLDIKERLDPQRMFNATPIPHPSTATGRASHATTSGGRVPDQP